ncbi:MAG TPA: hypothetical protein VF324_02620, partial [Methanobacterium sp.]
VTTPKEVPVTETKSSGLSRGRLSLFIFVIAAFFVGTGYGVYVISMPANNSAVAMTVNDSAFPANNTTANQTNTTTTKTTTEVTPSNTTTPSKTTSTSTTSTKTSNSSNTSKNQKTTNNQKTNTTKS